MSANRFLFVVGGARSGKSRFAQQTAQSLGQAVTFVATATAGDADMAARIQRHRADRPAHWNVIEAPTALSHAVAKIEVTSVVIVDCLTMWSANRMLGDGLDPEIEAEAEALARQLSRRDGPSIVVSNEVGLSVHPATELGRRYQDLLGRVNQIMAAHAGRSLFLVAGRALELNDPHLLAAHWLSGSAADRPAADRPPADGPPPS